jgi:hypothetical protein
MHMPRQPWLPLVLIACLAAGVSAADAPPAALGQPIKPAPKPKPPPLAFFLTPETAGPDFVVQGEYLGKIGDAPLGCQVVALDKGQFRAAFYRGGLPGDATFDDTTRTEVMGTTDGDKTVFNGKWRATVSGDTMTGTSDKGEDFSLKHTLRHSPTEGLKPPDGALVLFDGTNVDAWKPGRMDDRNLLCYGAYSKQAFGSFTLHVELMLPFMPGARGQARGNSGVYLQDRYEIQVLDSFGLRARNNDCAGVYEQIAPKPNMAYPPLSWQTYDIDFDAAQWDGTTRTKKAVITIKWNGVVVIDHYEASGNTPGQKKEAPGPGVLYLQDHGGDKVFFRNIWIVEHK